MSTSLSAPNTNTLYSKASLTTRTQSLHSLEESFHPPLPPALPPKTEHAQLPPPPPPPPASGMEMYEDPPLPVYRTKSYSQLDSDAVSISYSEYRPPLSAMFSLTEDEQRLHRTISRATLIDQDTGNVYQVKTDITNNPTLKPSVS